MSMFVQAMSPRGRGHAERVVALGQRVLGRARQSFVLLIEILVEAHAMMRQADRRVLSGLE